MVCVVASIVGITTFGVFDGYVVGFVFVVIWSSLLSNPVEMCAC